MPKLIECAICRDACVATVPTIPATSKGQHHDPIIAGKENRIVKTTVARFPFPPEEEEGEDEELKGGCEFELLKRRISHIRRRLCWWWSRLAVVNLLFSSSSSSPRSSLSSSFLEEEEDLKRRCALRPPLLSSCSFLRSLLLFCLSFSREKFKRVGL